MSDDRQEFTERDKREYLGWIEYLEAGRPTDNAAGARIALCMRTMLKHLQPEAARDKPCPQCEQVAAQLDTVLCAVGLDESFAHYTPTNLKDMVEMKCEQWREDVEQAFMAGQADCGVDPSYSQAQAYAEAIDNARRGGE